jgi:hypothetical protein
MITTKTLLKIAFATIGITAIVKMMSEPQMEAVAKAKYHIINVHDGSGTTKGKGWPWPDKNFYLQEVTFLENNGGGVLEVFNISQSIPNPITLEIIPVMPVPNGYDGEQAVTMVKAYNDSIATLNNGNKAAFWSKMEAEVLGFEPSTGNDYTYAEAHLEAVLKTAGLPQYRGWRTFALVYSDLLDDVPGGQAHPVNEELIGKLNGAGLNIALCSHTKNTAIKNLNAVPLTSCNDFIGLLQSSIH